MEFNSILKGEYLERNNQVAIKERLKGKCDLSPSFTNN